MMEEEKKKAKKSQEELDKKADKAVTHCQNLLVSLWNK